MDRYVVDASVIVASLLRDEPYHPAAASLLDEFGKGRLDLLAVSLLRFEVANALWKAAMRGRVELDAVLEAAQRFEQFPILYHDVPVEEIIKTAHDYDRTAYDAAYIVLARRENVPFVTADKRLYNALEGGFEMIRWIEEVG